MSAQQADYDHGTMIARFQAPIAPRGGTQFWSFLAEKVSPDFLPRNCFDLPRFDFLPPSFRFGGPGSFNIRMCFFCRLKALDKQPDKCGSLIV